jgi:hypothetical protein
MGNCFAMLLMATLRQLAHRLTDCPTNLVFTFIRAAKEFSLNLNSFANHIPTKLRHIKNFKNILKQHLDCRITQHPAAKVFCLTLGICMARKLCILFMTDLARKNTLELKNCRHRNENPFIHQAVLRLVSQAMRWLDFHNLPAAALPIRFFAWLL